MYDHVASRRLPPFLPSKNTALLDSTVVVTLPHVFSEVSMAATITTNDSERYMMRRNPPANVRAGGIMPESNNERSRTEVYKE